MKKLYSILTSLILLTFTSAKAEIGVGVSGALHMLDVSGSETTRQSGEVNRGSQEEDVMVGEVFVEAIAENGWTVGLAYIPTRDMGSKSRSDSNSDGIWNIPEAELAMYFKFTLIFLFLGPLRSEYNM